MVSEFLLLNAPVLGILRACHHLSNVQGKLPCGTFFSCSIMILAVNRGGLVMIV